MGPQVKGQNSQVLLKGDILDHALVLTLVQPRVTPTDRIDLNQKGDVTHQALLKIHNLIRSPGADPIPEVAQGLRGGAGHP